MLKQAPHSPELDINFVARNSSRVTLCHLVVDRWSVFIKNRKRLARQHTLITEMLQLEGSQKCLSSHGYGNCAPEKKRQAAVQLKTTALGLTEIC